MVRQIKRGKRGDAIAFSILFALGAGLIYAIVKNAVGKDIAVYSLGFLIVAWLVFTIIKIYTAIKIDPNSEEYIRERENSGLLYKGILKKDFEMMLSQRQ